MDELDSHGREVLIETGFDAEEADSVCYEIIAAMSVLLNRPVDDMEKMGDSVDLEAVELLCSSLSSEKDYDVTCRFQYMHHPVVVHSSEKIQIFEPVSKGALEDSRKREKNV